MNQLLVHSFSISSLNQPETQGTSVSISVENASMLVLLLHMDACKLICGLLGLTCANAVQRPCSEETKRKACVLMSASLLLTSTVVDRCRNFCIQLYLHTLQETSHLFVGIQTHMRHVESEAEAAAASQRAAVEVVVVII